MAAKKKFYITTAIDYVNARPHVGHAFEKTLADAIARYQRARGKDVFFLTGVDENAQKNVEAAQKAGIPVREFIDKNTSFFIELCSKLNLSHDDFVRTTAKEHAIVVQKIIKKIIDKGDIYKSNYEGLYCTGCETYYTEKDLIDGKCPEHNKPLELRKEEAYFFKLSKYQKQLLKIIPDYVVPDSRKNEVLARVKEGLNDICISRKGAKWGIDFPGDKDYKVWVWFDALINYISGLKDKEKKYWPADVHVIGKGINWFHAVIWPALLLSAGCKLPKTLLVHGYLTQAKEKMSKSLGNVIDPLALLEKYPADSVRYALLRCSVFDDSDFDEEIIITRHNNELANNLGNLVCRVSGLIEQNGAEKTTNKLIKKLKEKEINKLMETYHIDKALGEIFAFVNICNEYTQEKKPWETKDKKVLFELKESVLKIAELLAPFIPESAEKIKECFSSKNIKKADALFKKIEVAHPKTNVNANSQPAQKDKNINPKNKIQGVISMAEIIKYEDFAKLDLRVATIKKVEDIEGADKLYKLEVDIGNKEKRTILAGIKQHYKKEDLKDKQIIVIVNLEPRKMKGIESQGMLLAAVSDDHSKVILLSPDKKIDSGSKVS